jgi:uncharacterized membrane protein
MMPAMLPQPSARTEPSRAERLSRGLALGGVLALLLLCLAWETWLAPTGRGTLAIKAAPLLLPLPGLWRYRLYTFRWVSLFVWLYATEGLVRMGAEPGLGRALAVGEVLLSVLIFIACTAQIRQRLGAAKAANAA